MKKLFNLFKPNSEEKFVTVVSGLPRSGTSMMMKMLEAGGVHPIQDGIRTADDDNPKGYYEYERVKKLPDGDTAWVANAVGKSVKVISALLQHLPDGYNYRVLFMRREMAEILASQHKMLLNRGEDADKSKDEEMTAMFEKHLATTMNWMALKPNIDVLYVNYNRVVNGDTSQIKAINRFMDNSLDEEAIATVIDPNLYRQRK